MESHDNSLKTTALKTWVIILVIVGNGLLIAFLYSIQSVLLELITAIILAIALTPFVRYLVKHGFKKAVAATIALVTTMLLLTVLIGAIASPLLTQGGDLINNTPKLISNGIKSPALQKLDKKYNIIAHVKDAANEAPKLLSGSGTPVIGVVSSVFGAVSSFFVIIVLALFILIEGPTAWSQLINLLGKKQGKFVSDVSKKVTIAIGGFVNGNLLISLIAGMFALIVLLITRVPYPFALAALVAIFDLIPLVGAAIATVILGLVALSNGLFISILVIVLMLVYQFVEGNIIQPIIYGRTVKLSQLLIIVASIIGADLGGIVGVLLAIPIAAALQIIAVELIRVTGTKIEPAVSESVKDN